MDNHTLHFIWSSV